MLKKFISILLVIVSAAFPISCAWADEPDPGIAPKSYNGHMNTALDKSLYSRAEDYSNPSVSEQVMKIGMDFGREAVGWAQFENLSGGGFVFGYYDENRIFHAQRQTKADNIYINIHEWEDGVTPEGTPNYVHSIQVVNGIDSSVILTVDSQQNSLSFITTEDALIKYKDNFFQGGFECILNDEQLTVINYVGIEEYIKGVIPYEMSSYWPFEALRAQAVCARTYAIYNIGSYADYGFDLTDDTRSQVYRGTLDANSTTDDAVDSTAGQLVRYKGEVCEIYYFSADGGATEDGMAVFSTDKPYLAGKTDPFESSARHDFETWSKELSGSEISQLLNEAGYSIEKVTDIYPSMSKSGNVIALHFYDKDDNCVTIEGRRCYTILGLHNCRFQIVHGPDNFTFTGSGWGHNCGMSQWGAYAMADVYGYNYEDIIRFYFTGAYVA